MSVISTIMESFPLGADEVAMLIRTAPSRYKVHEIEKRNGRGKRTIAQPTAEIKAVQRLLLREYIAELPVSDVAKAYRKGVGIVDHATIHAPNRYLLKLDFKDFFPSVSGTDFLKHLKKYSSVASDDAKILTRIFFWRPMGERRLRLSIGAPSSPAISNTILFDFDEEVNVYCVSSGVIYTRYADDLAFSTSEPGVLGDVFGFVSRLCNTLRYPRLELNSDKTVFTSKKYHRQLTGLVLSNDGCASLGREKKRLLRATAHRFGKGDLSEEEVKHLRGWLAFAFSVEPEFVEAIKRMLGEDDFMRLMRVVD